MPSKIVTLYAKMQLSGMPLKIVCDDRIPFIRGVFDPYADVLYLPGNEIDRAAVKDADALIVRTRTICNKSLLEGSKVKIVASATIGYDHIDIAWCASAGIEWTNAPGCNSASVQQYVVSVLCSLARRFNLNLCDLTLGVVGVGHVGSKVAAAARALGMKVLLCDPPRARREGREQFVGLDELVRHADIITLHVPLSKEDPDATWHMFDSERIASLSSHQILINTSRGEVVDNKNLKNALKTGRIKASVLDVWENEPEIDGELLDLLSIATPHIAGYSADGKANGTAAVVRAVASLLGLPLEDWQPESIPVAPQGLSFSIDAGEQSVQDVLCKAVFHAYDVLEDDSSLRRAPSYFEQLRGDYPVRRDFSAFNIKLNGGSAEMTSALKTLGFNLIWNDFG